MWKKSLGLKFLFEVKKMLDFYNNLIHCKTEIIKTNEIKIYKWENIYCMNEIYIYY